MMVQLNLLPEVKEKYIKTERTKRLVFGVSFIAAIVAIGLVALLATVVYGAQKIRLSSLQNSIKESSKTISATKDLDKILTIQNQLSQLSNLHNNKPITSRLFDYLSQVTPNEVYINNVNVKVGDSSNQMTITGTAKSLETTNKFVDTIKFTKFTTEGSSDETNAFTDVVLSSFARGTKDASYTITMTYNPALFNSESKKLTLVVPKQVTTQSTVERPTDLFKQSDTQGNQ